MKFLTKHIILVIFAYLIFTITWLMLVSEESLTMIKHFIILRDFGNIIALVGIAYLVYSFSNLKDNNKKFNVLKNIYQILFFFILLNFSKLFANSILEALEIVQNTIFSNETVLNNVLSKIK